MALWKDCADHPGIVTELYASINERDFSRLENLFCDKVVVDFPGVGKVTGRAQAVLFFRMLLSRFRRLVFSVDEVVDANGRIWVVWENAGEWEEGESYSNRGCTQLVLVNGKIGLLSDYFKDTSFIVH